MDTTQKIKWLKIALVIIGLAFIFGIYTLTVLWPAGWKWHAEAGQLRSCKQ